MKERLSEKKYNKIKKMLQQIPQTRGIIGPLSQAVGVSYSVMSRIKRSKDYNDFFYIGNAWWRSKHPHVVKVQREPEIANYDSANDRMMKNKIPSTLELMLREQKETNRLLQVIAEKPTSLFSFKKRI